MDFINYTVDNGYRHASKVLSDYISHAGKGYKQYFDSSITTSAHECTHKTNSDIRNSSPTGQALMFGNGEPDFYYENGMIKPHKDIIKMKTGPGQNGFYLGQNRAIQLLEPNFRKSDVAQFIPTSLRASRFATYVTGQKEWDDTPLYIFDEWTAYCAGTDTAIDLKSINNTSPRGTDIAFGPAEFTTYAIAVGLAVNKLDPSYHSKEPKFLPFLKFNVQRAISLSKQCHQIFPWSGLDEYLNKLMKEPTFQPFLQDELTPEDFNPFG